MSAVSLYGPSTLVPTLGPALEDHRPGENLCLRKPSVASHAGMPSSTSLNVDRPHDMIAVTAPAHPATTVVCVVLTLPMPSCCLALGVLGRP